MAKIRIYNCFWFVLEYTVVVVSGKTERLCEEFERGNATVKCMNDETITLKKITYGDSLCQDTSNSDICHSNITTYFNNHCVGNNTCTLSIETLLNNNCKRPPRRLYVTFTCNWFFLYRYHSVHTCANSLREVHCSKFQHIHIENVKSDSECGGIVVTDAIARLKELCDDERTCSPYTYRDSSLYHERFVSFSYGCTGPTDSPITEYTHRTSSDNNLDVTTITTANVTGEIDMLPLLSFDKDHRIEIDHHSLNKKLYLCSYGWDHHDAGVLCKWLNKTWTGHAIIVDKLLGLKIANYSLYCNGLETSLFECNYTEDEQGCNTGNVAGAICCREGGRPGECATYTKLSSTKSDSANIGAAVGIPVALIVVVGIIVVIVFIRRRRCICKNSDKQISNSMRKNADDDYIGQQGISLPKYPSNNRILYNQATNRTKTQVIESGQEYSQPSKDAQSLYALSEEGVYDKANEKRHVVNDTAVYSRAIDTMYDSTDQHNRQERKEGTYDLVFGQKTEDQYDVTTRT